MNRKLFLAVLLTILPALALSQTTQLSVSDKTFIVLRDKYVIEFLRRNPMLNTYLGGGGFDSSLRSVDGLWRNHSAAALAEEDRWLVAQHASFTKISPQTLSPDLRVDREVALAQIQFLLHQHRVRRYQKRALDTYLDEPFRTIDWQLQGMAQTGAKTYGTDDDWALVAKRVDTIPDFLAVGRAQLLAGVKANNTPDWRMLYRHGLDGAEATAKYFEQTLPGLAEEKIAGAKRDELLSQLRTAAKRAATAYWEFRNFIATTFFQDATLKTEAGLKPQFRGNRYQLGEAEYNWALKNNFRINKSVATIYTESWPIVQATRGEMVTLARAIGRKNGWSLPANGETAVRAVFDELEKDSPKSDAEVLAWHREACQRLVEYGRKTGIFDVPADYQLDVFETPPALLASIDSASYFPAPPLKNSGVGRYYVSPTGNDPAALRANHRAIIVETAAHEGFPGHDWHFKMMTRFRDQISAVRWLLPGAVEDSSAMWADSMATEGWGLYAEALLEEPQPNAPQGFYTPEERLVILQWKLYRDLRVRVDTGLHTNRLSYDDAIDLFSQVTDFLPGSCKNSTALKSEAKRASCEAAERAVFRYTKWPTQAITYRLGRDEIFALRKEAAKLAGDQFSPKTFHLLFMKQGTIPSGYFRAELLQQFRKAQ